MRLVFAAAGLIAIAQASGVPAQTAPERPKIIVDGHGEAKTMPNIATVTYTLRGEGATSDEAVNAMVAMGARIDAALRGLDTTAEPQTGDVKVNPAKGGSCKENDYDPDALLSTGACAVVGYIATQSITVRTSDIKDAGTMVGLAGRGGAYDARIKDFHLADPGPAKRQAIAAALSEAQMKASAVATASHVSLGQILTISTGGANVDVITAQDIGSLRRVPGVMALNAPPPVPVNVKPEPITTTADVTVTYAIQ